MKKEIFKKIIFIGLVSIVLLLTINLTKATELGKVPGLKMEQQDNCCMCVFGEQWEYCEISDQCCIPYHPGCESSPCWY